MHARNTIQIRPVVSLQETEAPELVIGGASLRRDDPLRFLLDRSLQIDHLLSVLSLDGASRRMAHQMAYCAVVDALGCYLLDTLRYWINHDDHILHALLRCCPEFRTRTLSLSEILTRMNGLKTEVEDYLDQIVWYQVERVAPLIEGALSIECQPSAPLMKGIQRRCALAHGGGRAADGALADISLAQITEMIGLARDFASSIEEQLAGRPG